MAYRENYEAWLKDFASDEVTIADLKSIANDEKEIERAKRKGLPYAGFCYASETLIKKLAITDEELQHMKSIRKG